jgi:osmotically-inducible protein OsmY
MIKLTALQKITSILILSTLLQGCVAVVAGTAATSVMVAQDRRTAGTILEDKTIQLKALNVIKDTVDADPRVHVTPVSFNNRVLLVGQAPSRRIRAEIEQGVRSIHKIKHLHNEITVADVTPLKVRSVDSWITTKIKSEMALTKEIQTGRIKVTTEDGVVYLMGIVKANEDEIAVDIARHTKGVHKVVKIFEYEA